MAVADVVNIDSNLDVGKASLASYSMREIFFEWLSDGNAKIYAPSICVSCFDKISKYAKDRKLCAGSLWDITQHNVFKLIYQRILDAKLLRITDRNTYQVFKLVGQLYIKFLKEKPWAKVTPKPTVLVADADASISDIEEILRDAAETESESVPSSLIKRNIINPEDVVAWLVTQPNANGTLYLENVVRSYISALRSAPSKLYLASLDCWNVFVCQTVSELDDLWTAFRAAPNYREVNSRTSGSLSAGLSVYRRYLEHLEREYINEAVPFTAASTLPKTTLDSAVIEKLTNVLSAHFANGYRLNSPIELARFRAYAVEYLDEEISLTDEELECYVAACGTNFDGKVYVVGIETEEKIKSEVDTAVAGGAELIFYGVFYERHRDWLFAGSVISEDMLRSILEKLYPMFSFRSNYFSPKSVSGNELVKICDEILRVWGEDVLLSYDQISDRLPYIPVEKISSALAQNNEFIWNTTGVYTHTGRVSITDEERATIVGYVSAACRMNGYVSLSDVPLGEIEEQNYELSLTAIHNAVFKMCLAEEFYQNGKSSKIVTRRGDAIDAVAIISNYCRSADKRTLDELLNYQEELIGQRVNHFPALEAGYTAMVRLDKDTFVSESYVHFDTEAIDDVLDLFITSDYLPLKSVNTFAAFPHCGQVWNLYLLESYCRRYSKRYLLKTVSPNSKNAGIIVRQSCGLGLEEILADVIAHSSTPLDKAAIEGYLCDQGYIGRRSYSKANELIERARIVRERRD